MSINIARNIEPGVAPSSHRILLDKSGSPVFTDSGDFIIYSFYNLSEIKIMKLYDPTHPDSNDPKAFLNYVCPASMLSGVNFSDEPQYS